MVAKVTLLMVTSEGSTLRANATLLCTDALKAGDWATSGVKPENTCFALTYATTATVGAWVGAPAATVGEMLGLAVGKAVSVGRAEVSVGTVPNEGAAVRAKVIAVGMAEGAYVGFAEGGAVVGAEVSVGLMSLGSTDGDSVGLDVVGVAVGG